MRRRAGLELAVGFFIILVLLAAAMMVFRVSGLQHYARVDHYTVYADFINIGGLRVRAPVRVAGVQVGEVANIAIDPKTYKARVTLFLSAAGPRYADDTEASIRTEGILGANYISLTPGYSEHWLHDQDHIDITHSALVLEDMIGHLLFQLKQGPKDKPGHQ